MGELAKRTEPKDTIKMFVIAIPPSERSFAGELTGGSTIISTPNGVVGE